MKSTQNVEEPKTMNILKYVENNYFLSISIIICAISLIVTAVITTISFDTFWHIATGRDFLLYGDTFTKDHFTFTHYGETIKSNPVIFQLIIALFTSVFGLDAGLIMLKLFAFACFSIALYYFYKINRIHVLTVVATLPFIVYFLIQRGGFARPELFSYVFLMTMLALYFSAIREFKTKNLLFIAILLIVWLNYHSAIFGYIIVFGLFVEKGIQKIRGDETFKWRYFITWAILIFLTGFVNVKFSHFIFSSGSFPIEWKFLIAEYGSLDRYSTLYFRIIFFSTSAFLMFWLFKTQRYGMLIVCVLLVSQTWNIVRLLSFSGIIVSCLFSLLINDMLHKKRDLTLFRLSPLFIRNSIVTFIILISTAGHLFLSRTAYLLANEEKNQDIYFPYKIASYLEQNRPAGNIFNQFHYGGYLEYALPRGYKTYMDGRSNILFSLDFFKRYLQVLISPSALKEEVKKYGIDYAILGNTPSLYELIAKTDVFSLDYVDQYFFLATTGAANFPVSGKALMEPACWDKVISDDLIKEIQLGQQLLPASSPLLEIQDQLNDFSQTSNKADFFEISTSDQLKHDQTKRTLAYLALQNRFYEKAIYLFDGIKSKIITDIMAVAIAFINNEQYQNAYNYLTSGLLPSYFRDQLSSSEEQTLLQILKALSTIDDIEIDEHLLQDLTDVRLIDTNALMTNICETRILQKSTAIKTLDALDKFNKP